MGVVLHWWDGSWSTYWRRDVVVYAEVNGDYTLEFSLGRHSIFARHPDLASAEAEARRHLLPDVQWRDLSPPPR